MAQYSVNSHANQGRVELDESKSRDMTDVLHETNPDIQSTTSGLTSIIDSPFGSATPNKAFTIIQSLYYFTRHYCRSLSSEDALVNKSRKCALLKSPQDTDSTPKNTDPSMVSTVQSSSSSNKEIKISSIKRSLEGSSERSPMEDESKHYRTEELSSSPPSPLKASFKVPDDTDSSFEETDFAPEDTNSEDEFDFNTNFENEPFKLSKPLKPLKPSNSTKPLQLPKPHALTLDLNSTFPSVTHFLQFFAAILVYSLKSSMVPAVQFSFSSSNQVMLLLIFLIY
jgi:hypothetical protein